MFETIVGYGGGTSADPTYHNIGDHMETLQIRFDPQVVTYAQLLNLFWKEHDYTVQPWSRQYMNAVFYHNDEQKKHLMHSMEKLPGTIRTEILELSRFYPAEDYHQKFYLQRHSDITSEFRNMFPDFWDFVRSASAARVNGILGGYGSRKMVRNILPGLGLSKELSSFLMNRVAGRS